MGVAIRRYIDILIIIITFPYSTCISSFWGSSILTCLFIFKMFFLSFIYNYCGQVSIVKKLLVDSLLDMHNSCIMKKNHNMK